MYTLTPTIVTSHYGLESFTYSARTSRVDILLHPYIANYTQTALRIDIFVGNNGHPR